jgi:hypothetical protein
MGLRIFGSNTPGPFTARPEGTSQRELADAHWPCGGKLESENLEGVRKSTGGVSDPNREGTRRKREHRVVAERHAGRA